MERNVNPPCDVQETLSLLAAAFDVTPAASIITDGETLLYANERARKLFKSDDHGGLVGRPVFELVHPDGHETMRERGQVLRASSITLRGLPVKMVALDGSCFSLIVSATPVNHDDRRVFMFTEER
jgi:PAS domain S-box-containing protein